MRDFDCQRWHLFDWTVATEARDGRSFTVTRRGDLPGALALAWDVARDELEVTVVGTPSESHSMHHCITLTPDREATADGSFSGIVLRTGEGASADEAREAAGDDDDPPLVGWADWYFQEFIEHVRTRCPAAEELKWPMPEGHTVSRTVLNR